MSLKVWIAEGKVEEHPVTVTGKRKILRAFPRRWFSADVYNEGPDEVRVMINDQSSANPVRLAQDGARNFEFDAPKIEQVVLENDPGKTSSVIVTVMY